jgi:hypothetical protein
MKDLKEAIMKYRPKAENPDIVAEVALTLSNKLLDSIRYGNVAMIKELVTKDPENPNKYIVPVEKIHLTAARAVTENDVPFKTANSILKLLESEYRENKMAKLVLDSRQKINPEPTITNSQQR